jgi:hypothetical protein
MSRKRSFIFAANNTTIDQMASTMPNGHAPWRKP